MEKNMKQIRFARAFSVGIFLFAAISGLSYAADQALIEAAKKEGEIAVYDANDRRFLEAMGKLFKGTYKLGSDFAQQPVGTGPFKFDKWEGNDLYLVQIGRASCRERVWTVV